MVFLRFCVAVFALVTASTASLAADPIRGSNKYVAKCADCHSVASTSRIDRGRNSPAYISDAIANVGEMHFLSSLSKRDLEDIAAYLGNSPASLDFPLTKVGKTSPSQSITVRASGFEPINQMSVAVSGDYSRAGGTCGSKLAPDAKCTILVVFAPKSPGALSGKVTIKHSGVASAIPIKLAGTGSALEYTDSESSWDQ